MEFIGAPVKMLLQTPLSSKFGLWGLLRVQHSIHRPASLRGTHITSSFLWKIYVMNITIPEKYAERFCSYAKLWTYLGENILKIFHVRVPCFTTLPIWSHLKISKWDCCKMWQLNSICFPFSLDFCLLQETALWLCCLLHWQSHSLKCCNRWIFAE